MENIQSNDNSCINCEYRFTCLYAFKDSTDRNVDESHSKCFYDIERMNKDGLKLNDKAFLDNEPLSMMQKINQQYNILEEEIRSTPENQKFIKRAKMIELLIIIYKLKFGEKTFNINYNKNEDNMTIDVKKEMEEIRKEIKGEIKSDIKDKLKKIVEEN